MADFQLCLDDVTEEVFDELERLSKRDGVGHHQRVFSGEDKHDAAATLAQSLVPMFERLLHDVPADED